MAKNTFIRLPHGEENYIDREETGENIDMVVSNLQMSISSVNSLGTITTVMHYMREEWLQKHIESSDEFKKFRKLSDSLSICQGWIIHGSRVVIPQSI